MGPTNLSVLEFSSYLGSVRSHYLRWFVFVAVSTMTSQTIDTPSAPLELRLERQLVGMHAVARIVSLSTHSHPMTHSHLRPFAYGAFFNYIFLILA